RLELGHGHREALLPALVDLFRYVARRPALPDLLRVLPETIQPVADVGVGPVGRPLPPPPPAHGFRVPPPLGLVPAGLREQSPFRIRHGEPPDTERCDFDLVARHVLREAPAEPFKRNAFAHRK